MLCINERSSMVIEISLSKAQIEKRFGEKSIIETKQNGTVYINKRKSNWLFEIKQGRGMIFGPRFLWKIDIEDGRLICARRKTFLEITYLVLIIISSLFAPVLAAGVLSQLFATGLVGEGTVMAIMVYLVMILVLWIIYFFVFSKRAKEAIKDIIQHYYF